MPDPTESGGDPEPGGARPPEAPFARWGASRRTVDLGGPVNYLDFGGEGPPCLLVHGLGGSAINWLAVGGPLSRRHRVIAVDLVGFGHTPPAGRGSDVADQRAFVDRFIEEIFGEPVVLMGNSMGGLVCLLEAGEATEAVSRLVLVNPASPLDAWLARDPRFLQIALLAVPGLGVHMARRRLMTRTPEAYVADVLSLVCHETDRVDEALLKAHVNLARERQQMPWAPVVFVQAARSIARTVQSRRWKDAVKNVRAPTLLVHGSHDRLVSLATARKLSERRPDWAFHVFDAIGHAPQLECPEDFVRVVERWLGETP
jgi:pimeloyl-ACP methyl ester carboxylesterase